MIIAIVGSSLVSAVSLQIGAASVGFVLGKGDSLDSGAIKGPDYALGLLPGDRLSFVHNTLCEYISSPDFFVFDHKVSL
jgi:hypothetical protein